MLESCGENWGKIGTEEYAAWYSATEENWYPPEMKDMNPWGRVGVRVRIRGEKELDLVELNVDNYFQAKLGYHHYPYWIKHKKFKLREIENELREELKKRIRMEWRMKRLLYLLEKMNN